MNKFFVIDPQKSLYNYVVILLLLFLLIASLIEYRKSKRKIHLLYIVGCSFSMLQIFPLVIYMILDILLFLYNLLGKAYSVLCKIYYPEPMTLKMYYLHLAISIIKLSLLSLAVILDVKAMKRAAKDRKEKKLHL